MDGNKNRVDFSFTITRSQPVWFDARTGTGTYPINPFPMSPSNGLDNPFLITPPFATEAADGLGAYRKGLLVCFAVDAGESSQVKWNHLSGTATLYNAGSGAYEYNAYAVYAPLGLDLEPIGNGGTIDLNGITYDACPLYQIGQFSPQGQDFGGRRGRGEPIAVTATRLVIAGCTLYLNQDYTPVWTKLFFDVWNSDEIKFTGAFECSDSWHETEFDSPPSSNAGGPIDSAAQNFQFGTLQTYAARYRVQGIKSSQCPQSSDVGLVSVQVTYTNLSLQQGGVTYDSLPTTLPPNVDSVSFAAQDIRELGDRIEFEPGTGRVLTKATVIMSSFSCITGNWNGLPAICGDPAGATFAVPITLNLYQAIPGLLPGALIGSFTQVFNIPYRPAGDPTCPAAAPNFVAGAQYRASDGQCYNGLAVPIVFDLPGVVVPDQIVWGITYTTTANPNDPVNSLNQGTETFPLQAGTDLEPNGAFVNAPTAYYCLPAHPDHVFQLDDAPFPCWDIFRPLIRFEAQPQLSAVGTTLASAGKAIGTIVWDPEGPTQEGGIR
jgi:hypothetical protein